MISVRQTQTDKVNQLNIQPTNCGIIKFGTLSCPKNGQLPSLGGRRAAWETRGCATMRNERKA